MQPSRWERSGRGTGHRGSGIEKKKRKAEERLAAMRTANTALAASLFLSDTTPTHGAGSPMNTSTDQPVVADTNSASPCAVSPPDSPSDQLRTTLANVAAAAATTQHEDEDAEVDAFFASLDIDTTTTTNDSTQAAEMPNEGNDGGALVKTRAREKGARATKPKRTRAADLFDLSDDEKKVEGGDETRRERSTHRSTPLEQ